MRIIHLFIYFLLIFYLVFIYLFNCSFIYFLFSNKFLFIIYLAVSI